MTSSESVDENPVFMFHSDRAAVGQRRAEPCALQRRVPRRTFPQAGLLGSVQKKLPSEGCPRRAFIHYGLRIPRVGSDGEAPKDWSGVKSFGEMPASVLGPNASVLGPNAMYVYANIKRQRYISPMYANMNRHRNSE